MASVHDVARYILHMRGPMSTWKLQKLVYYSQAWHTTWEDELLFGERIEAWANGPVSPDLFRHHKGRFQVPNWPEGDIRRLTAAEKNSIGVVLDHYGGRSPAWLREMTHREPPWKDAREGLGPAERSERIIAPAAMAAYYGSL